MPVATSVLVVGGSLNLLTVALLLARRRDACVVVERHARTAIKLNTRSRFGARPYRASGMAVVKTRVST
jgi:hypothetical protein